MLKFQAVGDLAQLAETAELECTLAQGQDGKGELPKDI